MSSSKTYCGRFAPSPTGPLHFGSLIAAAGSYLDARANQGRWLVRMEDLDPPREMPGASDAILKALQVYGLEPDESPCFQSQRYSYYQEALQQLQDQGQLYSCYCTRKQIISRCTQGAYGAIYDGLCRTATADEQENPSTRLRVSGVCGFEDLIQGHYQQDLQQDIGDFHLRRRDGLYAYHIAVTVDDALQGVTHIVRGFDLLDSTPRQIYLQQQLGYPTPVYAHLPLAMKPDGHKLSKQNLATALDEERPVPLILAALEHLGQNPPSDLMKATPREVLDWAIAHWSIANVPRQQGLVTDIL